MVLVMDRSEFMVLRAFPDKVLVAFIYKRCLVSFIIIMFCRIS